MYAPSDLERPAQASPQISPHFALPRPLASCLGKRDSDPHGPRPIAAGHQASSLQASGSACTAPRSGRGGAAAAFGPTSAGRGSAGASEGTERPLESLRPPRSKLREEARRRTTKLGSVGGPSDSPAGFAMLFKMSILEHPFNVRHAKRPSRDHKRSLSYDRPGADAAAGSSACWPATSSAG
jgi:hypothetical protein